MSILEFFSSPQCNAIIDGTIIMLARIAFALLGIGSLLYISVMAIQWILKCLNVYIKVTEAIIHIAKERAKKKFQKQRGFTLVEIMIVLAIIGLLAAIAIPNLIIAKNNSEREKMAVVVPRDYCKEIEKNGGYSSYQREMCAIEILKKIAEK